MQYLLNQLIYLLYGLRTAICRQLLLYTLDSGSHAKCPAVGSGPQFSFPGLHCDPSFSVQFTLSLPARFCSGMLLAILLIHCLKAQALAEVAIAAPKARVLLAAAISR